MKYLYMAVTNDRMELPCIVGTAREVAAFTGYPLITVYTASQREVKCWHEYNIRRVEDEED